MINDIFDEIIEYCDKRVNCTRYSVCHFWDYEHNRCLFEVSPSFWDMDRIRDAIQKMREDNVKELKQNNKTKYEKECTPLDVNKAKEFCGKDDCDKCKYLDGDLCRLVYQVKENLYEVMEDEV